MNSGVDISCRQVAWEVGGRSSSLQCEHENIGKIWPHCQSRLEAQFNNAFGTSALGVVRENLSGGTAGVLIH